MQRMSTDLKREIFSTSLKHTAQLGRAIGRSLKGGEVIQLVSDIGGGKTTLTKSIVAGTGCKAVVASPTFTVSKEYQAAHLKIRHFDFYRLQDAGVVGIELQEGFSDPNTVTIIEWSDIVKDVLPTDTITITIQHTKEHERLFTIDVPTNKQYILRELA